MKNSKRKLTSEERMSLLATLRARFEKNMSRHAGADWKKIEARLEKDHDKLWSLHEMERTGGEPDVVSIGKSAGEFVFVDCSPESPAGRRSLCYDREALNSRKEHKPKDAAVEVSAEMRIELLTEEEYRALQKFGKFDTKTSSWVKTPDAIRELGGAVFCDRRYNTVFYYHNGAESYYAARGFRGILRL